MKKERALPEPVILAAQLRGERSIAKARAVQVYELVGGGTPGRESDAPAAPRA